MYSKPFPSNLLLAVLMISVTIVFLFTYKKTRASGDVDMLLVIALDVSASVDGEEFDLMREGLARAISSPEVTTAIGAGTHGAIGLTVLQWSGFIEKEVMIDWTRVSDQAQILAFATRVRQMKRRYDSGATDLGGAIDYSRKIVMTAPFQAPRKVIDIAGDGTNNVNNTPNLERDRAVLAGIVINGLAITGHNRGLIDYYTKFVIGGAGSFVENTRTYDDFEQAMRRKLAREINRLLLF